VTDVSDGSDSVDLGDLDDFDPAGLDDVRSGSDPIVPLIRLAIVEEYDAEPDQCTIYSVRDRETMLTTWISAAEGSYVAVEEVR